MATVLIPPSELTISGLPAGCMVVLTTTEGLEDWRSGFRLNINGRVKVLEDYGKDFLTEEAAQAAAAEFVVATIRHWFDTGMSAKDAEKARLVIVAIHAARVDLLASDPKLGEFSSPEPEKVPDTSVEVPDTQPTKMVDPATEAYERRIREAFSDLAEASLEQDRLETELKEAKKRRQTAVDHLAGIRLRGPENMPLFDKPAKGGAEPAPDDSWKEVAIDEILDLTSKQAEKLAEADVVTAGEFEDLRAKGDWPKGIGEKTRDKWEEQFLAWLSTTRDAAAFAEAADPAAVLSIDTPLDDFSAEEGGAE